MRLVINLLLVAGIIGGIYLLISSIREPIAFSAEKNKREAAVIEKLKQIRQAQEMYRNITGVYASDFDSLAYVLTNGQFMIIQAFGDPDDPTNPVVTRDTMYKSAKDSLNALGWNADSLRFVPFGKGVKFEISADTLTYQSTLVSVVEVGVQRKAFMGPYADKRFARYDDRYDPDSRIKFGNMFAPNTAGNWE
jgi:hypothetical protein